MLHLCTLEEGERFLDVDAEITDGAIHHRVEDPPHGNGVA